MQILYMFICQDVEDHDIKWTKVIWLDEIDDQLAWDKYCEEYWEDSLSPEDIGTEDDFKEWIENNETYLALEILNVFIIESEGRINYVDTGDYTFNSPQSGEHLEEQPWQYYAGD